MEHIIWPSEVNQKLTGSKPEVNRSELEMNQNWVGSGMRGIYKRRALAPCDFFITKLNTFRLPKRELVQKF